MRLRASTRKSIRIVCNARTVPNRDAPLKTQNTSSSVSKRSTVKASRRSQVMKSRLKSRKKRASIVGQPTLSAAPAGPQYALTPPANLDEPSGDPPEMRQAPPDAGNADFGGFCCWLLTCCGLLDWCCSDDTGSAEPAVYPEPLPPPTAPPLCSVKGRKSMQGSPLLSNQGKCKNKTIVFKQRKSIQQQQSRSVSAQGAY